MVGKIRKVLGVRSKVFLPFTIYPPSQKPWALARGAPHLTLDAQIEFYSFLFRLVQELHISLNHFLGFQAKGLCITS
jgi:hypothetical protein